MKKIKFSLKSLDPVFEKIEKITKLQRTLIYVGAFVVLIGPFVYFSYLPKLKQIDTLGKKSGNAQQSTGAFTTSSGPDQRPGEKNTKQAKARFEIAKRALPQQKEIPSSDYRDFGIRSTGRSGLFAVQAASRRKLKKLSMPKFRYPSRSPEVITMLAVFFDKVSQALPTGECG